MHNYSIEEAAAELTDELNAGRAVRLMQELQKFVSHALDDTESITRLAGALTLPETGDILRANKTFTDTLLAPLEGYISRLDKQAKSGMGDAAARQRCADMMDMIAAARRPAFNVGPERAIRTPAFAAAQP